MSGFSIKQGSRRPTLYVQLDDSGTEDWDLAGATVKFQMAEIVNGRPDTVKKVDASGRVVDAAKRIVAYDWAVEDTDTVGRYWGEFEISIPAQPSPGKFPSEGYLLIVIEPEV